MERPLPPSEKIIYPELVGETRVVNLSPFPTNQAYSMLPREINPSEVIFLPDLSPGGGPLPTGTCVVLNPQTNPDWRKYTLDDIGCGMSVYRSTMCWEEFMTGHDLWDTIVDELKMNKGNLGDLGSGNHFLQAAVDNQEQVYFVVHTGSRLKAKEVRYSEQNPRGTFRREYAEVMAWAKANRNEVSSIVAKCMGISLKNILDQPHDFFTETEGGSIAIYSGAVALQPHELSIVPSHMNGDMAVIKARHDLKAIHYAVSHGTGRRNSRSFDRTESTVTPLPADFRGQLHIPSSIPDVSLANQHPQYFRSLEETLSLLDGLVEEQFRLYPIAYIGQI